MLVKFLLDRKRAGEALSAAEVRELVDAYVRGDVPDYQMAAFAMAVCCRGMDAAETLALTEAMRDSGTCLDWRDLPLPTADKHSTGGVGDKLSLVIQPLAASCGVAVPSLTGRGLGHTGGTADKLEAIPGYNVSLSLADFRRVVAACGVSMTVQTAEICPADRKLYALRDVTGTVSSIPLITGSILSKKLAEGASALVFDVKCGSAAFMRTREEALALARALVGGARRAGRKSAALVTAMDEPLGFTVGNALEVREALAVLRGEDRAVDVAELSVEFAARMVALARDVPLDEARAVCRANLAAGRAYARFAEMTRLHGGDLEAFARLPVAPAAEGAAAEGGFVQRIDAMDIARVALELGAGRAKADDAVDPLAGVELLVARGARVARGQNVVRVHSAAHPERLAAAAAAAARAVVVGETPPPPKPLVLCSDEELDCP